MDAAFAWRQRVHRLCRHMGPRDPATRRSRDRRRPEAAGHGLSFGILNLLEVRWLRRSPSRPVGREGPHGQSGPSAKMSVVPARGFTGRDRMSNSKAAIAAMSIRSLVKAGSGAPTHGSFLRQPPEPRRIGGTQQITLPLHDLEAARALREGRYRGDHCRIHASQCRTSSSRDPGFHEGSRAVCDETAPFCSFSTK